MNTLNKVASASLLAMGLTLAACQTTQTAPTPASKAGFSKIDKNNDGVLTRDECADTLVTEIFRGRDANSDGKLTWTEWNVEKARAGEKQFLKSDLDKDGTLSLQEALVYGRTHPVLHGAFKEADKDRSGTLTLTEVQQYYASKEGPVR